MRSVNRLSVSCTPAKQRYSVSVTVFILLWCTSTFSANTRTPSGCLFLLPFRESQSPSPPHQTFSQDGFRGTSTFRKKTSQREDIVTFLNKNNVANCENVLKRGGPRIRPLLSKKQQYYCCIFPAAGDRGLSYTRMRNKGMTDIYGKS